MKRVLFIGTTYHDFRDPAKVLHLKAKFEGFKDAGLKIFIIGRGRPWFKLAWGCDFWLYPNRALFLIDAFWSSFWLCIFKKVDLVVVQSPIAEGFFGTWLKMILRKKLIVECHGDWQTAPFLVKKRKLAFLQKRIAKFLAKFSLKRADKIRCVSDDLAKKIKAIVPHKEIFVFPTFTDLSLFLDVPESEIRFEKYILFVGGLQKVKGIDYLLEAVSLPVHKLQITNYKLLIIGAGPEEKRLKAQSAKLKIAGKVIFKGKLPLHQVKELMQNCYCLVAPSLSEGLPRVILEAMALAKPVIASRVGGIPEVVEDGQTGFLVAPANSQNIAEALQKLLANPALAKKMGLASRATVKEKFSNQRYLEQYIEMLKD